MPEDTAHRKDRQPNVMGDTTFLSRIFIILVTRSPRRTELRNDSGEIIPDQRFSGVAATAERHEILMVFDFSRDRLRPAIGVA